MKSSSVSPLLRYIQSAPKLTSLLMPANGTGAATVLQIRNEIVAATAENFIMSGIASGSGWKGWNVLSGETMISRIDNSTFMKVRTRRQSLT